MLDMFRFGLDLFDGHLIMREYLNNNILNINNLINDCFLMADIIAKKHIVRKILCDGYVTESL